MTGVVTKKNREQQNIATNLPEVVEFHMPYKMTKNQPTTLKVAVRQDISINLPLGMSFIPSAKFTIDIHDLVVEAKLLEANPFEIEYHMPSHNALNIVPHKDAAENTTFHVSFIKTIKATKSFIKDYTLDLDNKNTVTKTDNNETEINFDFTNGTH